MKKINKIISIIIIFIIIICLSIFIKKNYFYDKYKLPEDLVFEYITSVNVFEDKNYFSLITNNNGELISEDEKIDTTKTGTKTKTISIKYNKKKYLIDMSVDVIDVSEPLILSYQSNINTTKMNVVYPCDRALYIDDYDQKPTCVIDGDVSYDEIGEYPVKMTISDKSGNSITKDIKIKVSELGSSSQQKTQTKIEPLNFSEIKEKYKRDNTMIGIDVSKWQGDIDFNKVREAGCEFVIIRIGVQAGRNYDYQVDGKFDEYINNAKAAGLKVGVYVYTTALNYNDGVKAAEFVIDTLKDKSLDLGVAYDWENYQYLMEYQVSLYDLSEGYRGFSDKLKTKGLTPHFYASKYYLEKFWMFIDDPVWLAHYSSETNYQGKYYMWQITNNGKIDGIDTNTVDINILYK